MSRRDDDFARLYPNTARVAAEPSQGPPRPLTGSPPRAPKRTRLAMADLLVAREKTIGTGRPDEETYAEAGFCSTDEYWSDATAETMDLPKFIHRLAIHFLNPSLEGSGDWYKLDLQDALQFAAENGEPWFIEVGGKKRRLHPREAAEYLLSRPNREHLVPPGLKAFLTNSRKPAATHKATKTPKKSSFPKQGPIIEMMRAMDKAELENLSEKEMQARFKELLGLAKEPSRWVCRQARDKVRSEESV
jgi:hypothetical protein